MEILGRVDPVELQVAIRFDDQIVKYDFGGLEAVSLANAVRVHKSQGSEFPAVVIPYFGNQKEFLSLDKLSH